MSLWLDANEISSSCSATLSISGTALAIKLSSTFCGDAKISEKLFGLKQNSHETKSSSHVHHMFNLARITKIYKNPASVTALLYKTQNLSSDQ